MQYQDLKGIKLNEVLEFLLLHVEEVVDHLDHCGSVFIHLLDLVLDHLIGVGDVLYVHGFDCLQSIAINVLYLIKTLDCDVNLL